MCLLLTELRGVVNQRFSPLVVLEDLHTCPARLGNNKKQNGMRRQIFLYPVPRRNVLFFAWLTTVPSKITAIADIERLSLALSAYSASAYTSSPRPDTTPLEFLEPLTFLLQLLFQQGVVSSFDLRGLLLRGLLGFHGPHGVCRQVVRAGRAHGQAPRLRPRVAAL